MITNKLGFSVVALSMLSLPAFAARSTQAPASTPPKEVSAEVRQQMATAHQKIADCLKSDRPLGECQNEMRTTCKEMMKVSGTSCPMMAGMGGMAGPHYRMRHGNTDAQTQD